MMGVVYKCCGVSIELALSLPLRQLIMLYKYTVYSSQQHPAPACSTLLLPFGARQSHRTPFTYFLSSSCIVGAQLRYPTAGKSTQN